MITMTEADVWAPTRLNWSMPVKNAPKTKAITRQSAISIEPFVPKGLRTDDIQWTDSISDKLKQEIRSVSIGFKNVTVRRIE